MKKTKKQRNRKRARSRIKGSVPKSGNLSRAKLYGAWSDMLSEVMGAKDQLVFKEEQVLSRTKGTRSRPGYEIVHTNAGCYPEMSRLMYMTGEQHKDRIYGLEDDELLIHPDFYIDAKEHGIVMSDWDHCTIQAQREIRYDDIPYAYKRYTKKHRYKKLSVWKRDLQKYTDSVGTIVVENKGEWQKLPLKDPASMHDKDDVPTTLRIGTCIIDDMLSTGFVAFQHKDMGFTGVIQADKDARDELAKIRDTPRTATGRKSPIIHYVKKHLRKTQEHGTVEVRGHTRGIEVYAVDDWRILTMVSLPTLYQRSPEYGMANAGKAMAMLGCRPTETTLGVFERLTKRGATLEKLQELVDEKTAGSLNSVRFMFMKHWIKTNIDLRRRALGNLDQMCQKGYHRRTVSI